MNDLRPTGTVINVDGVEREMLFTLPAIHAIQKKFGCSVDDVMKIALKDETDTCQLMEWVRDILTILFNDEAERTKDKKREVTGEIFDRILTARNVNKIMILLLVEYGYDLPDPDDDEDGDPNTESGEQK